MPQLDFSTLVRQIVAIGFIFHGSYLMLVRWVLPSHLRTRLRREALSASS